MRRDPKAEQFAERSIDELPLSVQTYRAVKRLGLTTLGALFEARAEARLNGVSAARRAEIRTILEPYEELWQRTSAGREFLQRNAIRRFGAGRRQGFVARAVRGAESRPVGKDVRSIRDESIVGRALTDAEAAICASTPAGEMGLFPRAAKVAESLGLGTALDVALARARTVFGRKNCGKKTLKELRAGVEQAISGGFLDTRATSADHDTVRSFIDEMLASLADRERFVLSERFGLWEGERETLEDLGNALGLTRERARQIEKKAIARLNHSAWKRRAIGVLAHLRRETIGPEAMASYCGVLTLDELHALFYPEISRRARQSPSDESALAFRFLTHVFASDARLVGDEFLRDAEGRYFISETRMQRFIQAESGARAVLIAKGRPVHAAEVVRNLSEPVGSDELERFAEVSTVIGVDWTGHIGLRRWPFFERRNVGSLVQRALMELHEPTHFTYIAAKTNAMFPDKGPFTPHNVSAVMLRYVDAFVSLGRGMYALKNWGVTRPPFLKDFLAQAIRERGGKAAIEDLAEAGERRYGFKRTSIRMSLNMNPGLFRVGEGGWAELV